MAISWEDEERIRKIVRHEMQIVIGAFASVMQPEVKKLTHSRYCKTRENTGAGYQWPCTCQGRTTT